MKRLFLILLASLMLLGCKSDQPAPLAEPATEAMMDKKDGEAMMEHTVMSEMVDGFL